MSDPVRTARRPGSVLPIRVEGPVPARPMQEALARTVAEVHDLITRHVATLDALDTVAETLRAELETRLVAPDALVATDTKTIVRWLRSVVEMQERRVKQLTFLTAAASDAASLVRWLDGLGEPKRTNPDDLSTRALVERIEQARHTVRRLEPASDSGPYPTRTPGDA